jgi:ANTAR domain
LTGGVLGRNLRLPRPKDVHQPEERRRPLTPDEREQAADQRERLADEREQAADEREQAADQRDRELLTESATARLQARLETMPVIEQAKGIIMEQRGCTAEQAFDILRQASQRSNVPVRELAVRIVGRHRPQRPRPRPHAPRSQRPAP